MVHPAGSVDAPGAMGTQTPPPARMTESAVQTGASVVTQSTRATQTASGIVTPLDAGAADCGTQTAPAVSACSAATQTPPAEALAAGAS